jgi:hypothetical protein
VHVASSSGDTPLEPSCDDNPKRLTGSLATPWPLSAAARRNSYAQMRLSSFVRNRPGVAFTSGLSHQAIEKMQSRDIFKRSPTVAHLSLIASVFVCALGAAASGVEPPGVMGFWMGTMLQHGIAYRIVLQVTEDAGGKLAVSMESVDQRGTLPGENAILEDAGLSFEIRSVGKYQGTLAADGNTIGGTWTPQETAVPLIFARTSASAVPTPVPLSPARPPVALSDLKPVLDRELEPVLRDGLLSTRTGGGLVIGVLDQGQRAIFSYGTAHQNSIFEIGSITKTFTGLIFPEWLYSERSL